MKVLRKKRNKNSLVYVVQLSKYEEKRAGGKKFVIAKESFSLDGNEKRIKRFFVKSWREALHLYDRMKKVK